MPIVRVSSRYMITIPRSTRTKLGIEPGQRFVVEERDGGIVFMPVPEDPIEFLCGVYKDGPSLTQALLEERARDLKHE